MPAEPPHPTMSAAIDNIAIAVAARGRLLLRLMVHSLLAAWDSHTGLGKGPAGARDGGTCCSVLL